MSNPSFINTANVKQFGFKTDFFLEDKKIKFDIAGHTIFNAGGANLVQGINFEVIDPSGILLSVIDFPNKDIDPATQTTYEVILPNGFSQFGWYFIKGVIKEQDGQEYSVELRKNICKPKEFKNGVVDGSFDAIANCEVPKLTISETTDMSYAGLSPLYVSKNGVLYYPKGTLNDVPFTFTPFEINGNGKVYTGSYTIRNKTIATYDLQDLVYVHVSYNTSKEFDVNCNSSLCKILCCVEKLYDSYHNDCKSEKGKDAKQKLDKIAMPLIVAALKEKCGQGAGDEIAEIEKVIGCDCGCGSESVEPKPLMGNSNGSQSINMSGACATTVTPTVSGSTVSYEVKTKLVSIDKSVPSDASFAIEKVEDNCNIIYKIKFDYKNLSTTILNTIKNDSQLTNLFNSIVNVSTGIDLNGIDGKCIINIGSCDYSLSIVTGIVAVYIKNIVIDGVTYTAPSGLASDDDIAISNWLNALGLGVFNVFFDSNTFTTVITSPSNPRSISTMLTEIGAVNPTLSTNLFSKSCKGLKQILQAIINYLCELSTKQIKLGDNLILCRLKDDGTIEQVPFSSDKTLYEFLQSQSQTFCKLLDTVTQLTGIDCKKIKSLFPESSKKITDVDFVLGTKEGDCARISYLEMADIIIHKVFEDSVLHQYICTQIQGCGQPVCSPVNNITVSVDTGIACTQLSNINGSVS